MEEVNQPTFTWVRSMGRRPIKIASGINEMINDCVCTERRPLGGCFFQAVLVSFMSPITIACN